MHAQRNEKGFTLVEMLLVLAITMVIFTLVATFSYKFIGEYNDKQIQYEVQLKLREAQTVALANKTYYIVTFKYNTLHIYQNVMEPPYFIQPMPSSIYAEIGFHGNNSEPFTFSPNLKVNGIGYLNFYTERGNIYYTINIGKGRFSYAK